MNKFIRIVKSFYKNIIIKRKFRSYWMSFTDSEYRSQITRIYNLTKNSTGAELRYVPTDTLVHGHKLIYHSYAQSLIENEEKSLEPIKVFFHEGKHIVVDGNHRLPAILFRAAKHKTNLTYCKVIV